MKLLLQLVSALGTPRLLKRIGLGNGRRAAVARWRFAGGPVEVDATDAVRIVLCLSGADAVHWQVENRSARRPVEAGSVSVMSPSEPPKVSVQGPVDVLQVLLEPTLVEEVADRSGIRLFSVFDDEQDRLRRLMLRTLVAASRGETDDVLLLGSVLYELAEQLGNAEPRAAGAARGGLARASRRRVEDLISDCFDRAPEISLCLDDLAGAAGLSVHHFIKAFRHDTGRTPYAYVLDSRLRRSMRLLSQPVMSVAEAADRTGFSSPAHFVASFRRHHGITPGVFRAAVRG